MSHLTLILYLSLLLYPQGPLTSYNHESKSLELYRDANTYFYFEDYEEALALYLKLAPKQPDNYNLTYRIGFCYLNIPGKKAQAVPFLRKAASHTTRHYNPESITEQNAPINALFYLGNAYFINNRLDSALLMYNRFFSMTKGKGKWDFAYLNHQIEAVKRSGMLQLNSINMLTSKLEKPINTSRPNYNAVISGDGNTLAYTTRKKFYQAIMIAHRNAKGNWDKPRNITLDLRVEGTYHTLALSYNGKELYLFKDDTYDGNIYVSSLQNGKWRPVTKLNRNINTEAYETHACLSADGRSLYFTSNRDGGYGGMDIYVSERNSPLGWGKARNLGPLINTPYNEETPFITTNGEMLFFSSEGHPGIGGYDIFVSQLTSEMRWGKPVNLGYPLNTTDDDRFFFPVNNGEKGLIALFDENGKNQNIYSVELFIPRFKKNLVARSGVAERITDKTFSRLVVDTTTIPGMAVLIDAEENLTLSDYSNGTVFLNGKPYPITNRSSVRPIGSKQNLLPRKIITPLSRVPATLTTRKPFRPTRPKSIPSKEYRMGMLKKIADTNTTPPIHEQPTPDTSIARLLNPEINQMGSCYLMEMLLMVAPINDQKYLSPVLTKGWISSSGDCFNNGIFQFSEGFRTDSARNALVRTLCRFTISLSELNADIPNQNNHNISDNNAPIGYAYFYKRLINLSSAPISHQLDSLASRGKCTDLGSLLEHFEQSSPQQYASYLRELSMHLTRITFETYKGLSPKEKEHLYRNIMKGEEEEEKTALWSNFNFIGLLLSLLLVLLIVIRKYYNIKRILRKKMN